MLTPAEKKLPRSNTMDASDHWLVLESADLQHAPQQAWPWVQEIYKARRQPQPIKIWWQRLWARLDLVPHKPSQQAVMWSLYQLGNQLTDRIEHDMDAKNLPYHNKTHAIDVLILSSHLLECWKNGNHSSSGVFVMGPTWCPTSAACLLLAALCHDWGHDGNPSSASPSLEEYACQLLADCWPARSQATADDWLCAKKLTQTLILSTQRHQLLALHHRYKTMGNSAPIQACMEDWVSLLMTESDIGASLLPHLGQVLTAQVWQEKMDWLSLDALSIGPNKLAELRQLRKNFLANSPISSPCAQQLGLPFVASLNS